MDLVIQDDELCNDMLSGKTCSYSDILFRTNKITCF